MSGLCRTACLAWAAALVGCGPPEVLTPVDGALSWTTPAAHVHDLGAPSVLTAHLRNVGPIGLDVTVEAAVDPAGLADVTPGASPPVRLDPGEELPVLLTVTGLSPGAGVVELSARGDGAFAGARVALTVQETCPTGQACDDGNACTSHDVCADQVCLGEAVLCDAPVSPCEQAHCDPDLGCVVVDDPSACDDGNPCTTDLCDDALGCAHVLVPDAVPCGVRDGCVSWSFCEAGVCTPRAVPDGAPCDDENACTGDDLCQDQVCTGAAINDSGAVLDLRRGVGGAGSLITPLSGIGYAMVESNSTGTATIVSVLGWADATLEVTAQVVLEDGAPVPVAPVPLSGGRFLMLRKADPGVDDARPRAELWQATANTLAPLSTLELDISVYSRFWTKHRTTDVVYLLWLSGYDAFGLSTVVPIDARTDTLSLGQPLPLEGSPRGMGTTADGILVRTATYGIGDAKYGTTIRVDVSAPTVPVVAETAHEENFYFGRDCYAVTTDYIVGGRVADLIGAHGIIVRQAAGEHLLVNEDLTQGAFEPMACNALGGNWLATISYAYGNPTYTLQLWNLALSHTTPAHARTLDPRSFTNYPEHLTVSGDASVLVVGAGDSTWDGPAHVLGPLAGGPDDPPGMASIGGPDVGGFGHLVRTAPDRLVSVQSRGTVDVSWSPATGIALAARRAFFARADVVGVQDDQLVPSPWRNPFERYDLAPIGWVPAGLTGAGAVQPILPALSYSFAAATAHDDHMYLLDARPSGARLVVVQPGGPLGVTVVGDLDLGGVLYDYTPDRGMWISPDGRRLLVRWGESYADVVLALIDVSDPAAPVLLATDDTAPDHAAVVFIDDESFVTLDGDEASLTALDSFGVRTPLAAIPWRSRPAGVVGRALYLGHEGDVYRLQVDQGTLTGPLALPDRAQSTLALPDGNVLVSTPTALAVVKPPCNPAP